MNGNSYCCYQCDPLEIVHLWPSLFPTRPSTPRGLVVSLQGMGELHGNETVAVRCGPGLLRGLSRSWLSPRSYCVLTRQQLGLLETSVWAVTCSLSGLSQDLDPSEGGPAAVGYLCKHTLIVHQNCWDVF